MATELTKFFSCFTCVIMGRALSVLFLLVSVQGGWAAEAFWTPLAEDGLHDPTGPALSQLEEPRVVLSQLPRKDAQGFGDATGGGNQVRWVHALQSGAISPRRSRTLPETKVPVLDMDILLDLRGSMRIVRFPHRAHTEWLACNNCHDEIFRPKIGANNISMYNILNGEQCGLCHGAVSFPLTECEFCHSVHRPGEVD